MLSYFFLHYFRRTIDTVLYSWYGAYCYLYPVVFQLLVALVLGHQCYIPHCWKDMRPINNIILQNRVEYHLILSWRGCRPSWLNQGVFHKTEQDNCFIIQQIFIVYHFHNKKNFLKLATNDKHKSKISRNQSLPPFTSSRLIFQTHIW